MVSAGSVVALAEIPGGALDIVAGVVLVVALAVLARGAIRLAADPARRDVEPPSPGG